MPTLVVFGGDEDDSVHSSRSFGGTYEQAREGTAGVKSLSGGGIFVGQDGSTQWDVYEAFLRFDTSSVTGTVSSALLQLYGQIDSSATDFTAEVRSYDWGATVTTGDYIAGSLLGATTLLATLSTAGFASETYMSFTEVALASNVVQDTIYRGGYTQLMVASDRERLDTSPSGGEFVSFYPGETVGTTKDPKLTLVYTPARYAFVSGDRAKETTTTTGTGDITLAGAASGFQAFSSVAINRDLVTYAIVGTTEWEVGIGSWVYGNYLTRDKVLASSNAGALVNFSAGTKDVFNTLPAAHGTLPVISRLQAADTFVPRDTTTYSPDDYEIGAGFGLEMGPTAGMEIG